MQLYTSTTTVVTRTLVREIETRTTERKSILIHFKYGINENERQEKKYESKETEREREGAIDKSVVTTYFFVCLILAVIDMLPFI